MAKAINWPKEFYDEVINEKSYQQKVAFRLGSLYFDTGYYSPNEVVDIRVDHKVTRAGRIAEELKISSIDDLTDEILNLNKDSLKTKTDLINFLASNYNQPVDGSTIVTVIVYENLPMQEATLVDDPHMN